MAAEDWIDFDYYDEELRDNIWEDFRKYNKTKWMLKDKTIINIKDMTTSHIQNSIKMLEKINWENCKAYEGLTKELETRNG